MPCSHLLRVTRRKHFREMRRCLCGSHCEHAYVMFNMDLRTLPRHFRRLHFRKLVCPAHEACRHCVMQRRCFPLPSQAPAAARPPPHRLIASSELELAWCSERHSVQHGSFTSHPASSSFSTHLMSPHKAAQVKSCCILVFRLRSLPLCVMSSRSHAQKDDLTAAISWQVEERR